MFRRKWLVRMLSSYIPVFFLITSFLLFIFFQLLSDQNRKQTIQAHHFLTSQVKQMIEEGLKGIDYQATGELSKNEQLRAYFSAASGDAYNIYLATEWLTQLNRSSSLIDSVYLVRMKDESVLHQGKLSSAAAFPDSHMIGMLLEDRYQSNWSAPRMYTTSLQRKDKAVTTLVRKVYVISDKPGYVVINVSVEALYGLVQSMYNPDVSYVRMMDRDNVPLKATVGGAEEQLSESEALAVSEGAMSGPLARQYAEYTGWTYESGLVQGRVVAFMSALSVVWVVIALCTTVLGIAVIAYITWSHYRPIEEITELVRGISGRAKQSAVRQGNLNEFKLIETAVDELINQVVQLQQQTDEVQPVRRRHLFNRLIEGAVSLDDEEWNAEAGRLGVPVLAGLSKLFVVEMDKYAAFCSRYNERDQQLMKFILERTLLELGQSCGILVWTEWVSTNRLAGVLQFATLRSDAHYADGEAYPACDEAQMLDQYLQWISVYLDFTVTIGLGEETSGLVDAPKSYQQAVEALKFKIVAGTHRVIAFPEVDRYFPGDLYAHLSKIRSIIQQFRAADPDWKPSLVALFDHLRSQLCSAEEIGNLLNYMLYHLDRVVSMQRGSLYEAWRADGWVSLNALLEQSETLDEIEQPFIGELRKLFDHMETMRESSPHYYLMNNVKTYITEQYSNPNLSLDHLSSEFKLSSKYLSQLFKEELGENFSDYLVRLRMEYAKWCLKQTDSNLNDIAAQVGYSNAISFGRVFKREEGITPGAYRRQMSGGVTETETES